ncbi:MULTISPECIES: hypothetical protein [Methanobacterium]|uniref:Uncharacterized protein n=1 Tax=Methanobacterium bryantii TaxID=2161 RepID=A0A2A2H8I7_METBR|nr:MULTISPECIES: hypothetical protein [Methanobacterium]OEC87872.1 hypothetical protein A9507_06770 [Methanobacterium sp. A39]PAV05739.1 hypothetical protein ASJ80_08380 [Methanobacterium bryantii]
MFEFITNYFKTFSEIETLKKENYSLKRDKDTLNFKISMEGLVYTQTKCALKKATELQEKYYENWQEAKGQIEKITPLLDDIYMNAKLEKNCVLMTEILEIKLQLGVFDENIWGHSDE